MISFQKDRMFCEGNLATDCYNYSYIHIAHNENKENQVLVKLNTRVHYI